MAESLTFTRAQFAFKHVSTWAPAWRGAATTRAKSLPVQLRTQGLATTLATLIQQSGAKESSAAGAIAELIAAWLLKHSPRRPFGELPQEAREWEPKQLLRACLDADRTTYAAAQGEALAIAEDIKILAQAWHGST